MNEELLNCFLKNYEIIEYINSVSNLVDDEEYKKILNDIKEVNSNQCKKIVCIIKENRRKYE